MFKPALLSVVLALAAPSSQAADITVQVQNLTRGVYFTPLLIAAHADAAKAFSAGSPASANLQKMAEGGDISGLASSTMAGCSCSWSLFPWRNYSVTWFKATVEAAKKAIRLEMEIPQGTAIVVCADIGLIQRVLQNLIDNALRHTPPGGRVWVRMETGDSGRVWIQVVDTGSGIAQPDLPLIFERYFRAGKMTGESQSGNGLGLAIVKRILDLHGALISVHSSVGAGTRIGFELKINCTNTAGT